jgi:hypothetical protein
MKLGCFSLSGEAQFSNSKKQKITPARLAVPRILLRIPSIFLKTDGILVQVYLITLIPVKLMM